AERLQFGGHIQLAAGSVAQDFPQIRRASLGRDSPKDISEILGPKLAGVLKITKFHLNFDVSLLALHFGLAVSRRHQWSATEVDLGSSAAIPVADRLGGPLGHGDAIDGSKSRGRPVSVFLSFLCRVLR